MNMFSNEMSKFHRKVIVLYLLLLSAHVAHVFEEVWGRFWILNEVGLGWFLTINWVLFCIPVTLFYFVLRKKRWAYNLSMVYSAFMALQGIFHNVATIVTGRYHDGLAGGFTGVFLLLIGAPLTYYLWKGRAELKSGPKLL